MLNHKGKRYFCLRCLNPFGCQESLNKHQEYGNEHEVVKIELPKEETMLKFENYHGSEKVPFVVYADFESYIKPLDTCESNPEGSYTKQYQKHEPSSLCYYIKCFDETLYKSKKVNYTGKNVAQMFVETLIEDIGEIAYIPSKKMDNLSPKQQHQYDNAANCRIYNEEFTEDGGKKSYKVRDHYHFTGKFRGAGHNLCNLKHRRPKFTPVLFHNLSGYDAHFFIKNLGGIEGNTNCIPNTDERYISFTKYVCVGEYTDKEGKTKRINRQIRFVDTFKFMAASLGQLVSNLHESRFNNVRKYYPKDRISLLLRKGVYPYVYMDSPKRLKKTQLPAKEAFYSNLNDKHITDEDYANAHKVWKAFDCKNMRDYHVLYNDLDVLLLADVFENFRDICIKNYNLDPTHYYTAPGLSWDAMLKVINVELELLSDMDMLLTVEKGIRGGVSMISNRYGRLIINTCPNLMMLVI